jgi:hypothetical protein
MVRRGRVRWRQWGGRWSFWRPIPKHEQASVRLSPAKVATMYERVMTRIRMRAYPSAYGTVQLASGFAGTFKAPEA